MGNTSRAVARSIQVAGALLAAISISVASLYLLSGSFTTGGLLPFLVALGISTLVAAFGFLDTGPGKARSTAPIWAAVGTLAALVVLGSPSIGLFFAPALVFLVVCAIAARVRASASYPAPS